MKKYLYLAIIEDGKVIQRVIPCEYASANEIDVIEEICVDNRDLTVAYVSIKNFGKRIYAAFTEEQYKQFDECRRCVDFAGIVEGYKNIP